MTVNQVYVFVNPPPSDWRATSCTFPSVLAQNTKAKAKIELESDLGYALTTLNRVLPMVVNDGQVRSIICTNYNYLQLASSRQLL